MHKPVTVAEVFIGEPEFFGTKQERDIVGMSLVRLKPFPYKRAPFLQRLQHVPQIAVAHGSGSHNQGAVRHSLRYGGALLGASQQFCSAYSGPRFSKCNLKRIYNPESAEAEIAHGARSRSNIQRIACVHQDNAKAI
jgi:hypothetical protein